METLKRAESLEELKKLRKPIHNVNIETILLHLENQNKIALEILNKLENK